MPRARLLELLGLPSVATPDEIKARYRELARRHHPDVSPGDDRAHVRFRAIAAAYEQLTAEPAPVPAPAPATAPPCVGLGRPADGLEHRRAELRTRLARVTRSFRRAQADARDGAAKAAAARARGDEAMARHFDRRQEVDQGRADGLRAAAQLSVVGLALQAGAHGCASLSRSSPPDHCRQIHATAIGSATAAGSTTATGSTTAVTMWRSAGSRGSTRRHKVAPDVTGS